MDSRVWVKMRSAWSASVSLALRQSPEALTVCVVVCFTSLHDVASETLALQSRYLINISSTNIHGSPPAPGCHDGILPKLCARTRT